MVMMMVEPEPHWPSDEKRCPFSLRLYPSNFGVRIFCEGMGIFSFGSLMVHEIAKSGNLVLRCRVLPLGLSS